MYKEVLRSIESIEIYPLISLIIFFGFFMLLLYRVIKTDNALLSELSSLPLENNETVYSNSKTTFNNKS